MKHTSATDYVWSSLAGLILIAIVSFSAYLGGYLMLADKNGLFPSKEIFQFYEPAVRFQRWATGKPVNTGYVAANGMRRNLRLP